MVNVASRPQIQARSVQPTPVSAVDRLVRFEIGGDLFALPLEQVAEIVALGVASATAPRGWVGTLIRSERPVPIGDLAFLLGVSPAVPRRHDTRAIILRGVADEITFGLTVDAVPAVIAAAGASVQPLPPVAQRAATSLVSGSVVLDGILLLVLDLAAIRERLAAGLTRAEDGRITELRALTRRPVESHRSLAGRVGRSTALPVGDLQALALAPIEAADGGDGFVPALPIGWVQEVLPIAASRRLPHMPATLVGLIERRGRALPVIDLAQRLTGIPGDSNTPRQRLLIVGQPGAEPLGALLVPGVRGLHTLTTAARDSIAPPSDTPDPGLLLAWAKDDTGVIALLDPAALFS